MTSHATGHLDLTVMLAFHDAFRRDLGHLARAASRRPADLDDPNRRTAVLAGWELFKTYLHIHHTAEDNDLWPRMRTHLADRPDELALLQAMQDEHARIDPLLEAVEGAFADRDGGHQRLGDTVDALAGELCGPGRAPGTAAGGLPADLATPLRPPRPLGASHPGMRMANSINPVPYFVRCRDGSSR
jgi:hypothetical protein